jgi:hypothetical protein
MEKEGKLPGLLDLISERPRETEDVQWVAGRYAQVWALMHFLWNKRPNELVKYLEDLQAEGTPRGWIGFFKSHFGEDLEGLDGELRRYVAGL